MSDVRTCFKRVDYDLSGLLAYIDIGDIGLPDIQRPFVWSNAKVRDLFDSMYRGFPVGYLLFWSNGFTNGTRTIGMDAKQHRAPGLLIVDGQQRLTSLYAVFRGRKVLDQDYRERQIEIAFRPRDGKFEVADAAIRKDPEFIASISDIWSSGKSSHKLVKEFLAKVSTKGPLTDDEEEIISHNLDRLFDLQKFPFTALEIASTVSEAEVADIFVRINSEGVKLNQADFILTLMSVFWDEGRHELERFSRQSRHPSLGAPSPFNYYIQPDPDQLLRVSIGFGFHRARLQHVYNILRGKDLDSGDFSNARRDAQFAILRDAQAKTLNLNHWHAFMQCISQAGYRRSEMISSKNALLYAYVFYLIGKCEYGIDHFTLKKTIARWFFMTTLTGRYTGSPESIMEQDLARLRSIDTGAEFVALLDRIIAANFTDDYWNITLPNDLATSSGSSPSLNAYHAALNILDAEALFSEVKIYDLLDPALHAVRNSVERHHLFPKKYLASLGIVETRETNQIANFAYVEWPDNISISDTAPHDYWPKFAARFALDSAKLQRMHYWHALPDGWYDLPYGDFLAQRRSAMARVIRDAFTRLSQ